ncbi:unnamed protein product [Ranitomeya imitator]|uniref:DCN1-like protein n=1 Tax=Ranitomeya imitator TaxID=111125 RepID=A0ABN9LE99_9NEOB|nr:unnamed protein product [Ranitomeya imitator]
MSPASRAWAVPGLLSGTLGLRTPDPTASSMRRPVVCLGAHRWESIPQRAQTQNPCRQGTFYKEVSSRMALRQPPGRHSPTDGIPISWTPSWDGNQGKHRVTKHGPALSYPMFTLVTGIVGRWRAVCVTALQRPNSDAAAIRIVVGQTKYAGAAACIQEDDVIVRRWEAPDRTVTPIGPEPGLPLGYIGGLSTALQNALQTAVDKPLMLPTSLYFIILHSSSSGNMPVKKKRKSSSSPEEVNMKKCRISSYCRTQTPNRVIGEDLFSSKKCLAWFYEYAGQYGRNQGCGVGPDEIVGPEAMEKFCEDIGVEPENIIMLVLAWKLEAENMGFFTKEEWLKGMTSLQCDCTEKLQGKFDYLRAQLNDNTAFKNIYRYAFDFARDKDQRSLDMDTAKSMLALVLGRTWPLFSVFFQYLEQSKYRVMNKDQWYNVLEFSRTVSADLSNYDEDGACE